jgi:hypothetical protein
LSQYVLKAYGEVSPEFIHAFADDLQPKWHLWDDNGVKHKLTFDRKYIVPHLIDGWFPLIEVLGIHAPSEVHFFYYGGPTFRISIKGELTNTALYPSWHSLSTKPNLTTYFEVKLSKYTSYASQLVIL